MTPVTPYDLEVAAQRLDIARAAYQAAGASTRRQAYVRYLELQVEFLETRNRRLRQLLSERPTVPAGAGDIVVPFPKDRRKVLARRRGRP